MPGIAEWTTQEALVPYKKALNLNTQFLLVFSGGCRFEGEG